MAVRVPSNRDQCVLIAEGISDESELTEDQIVAYRRLYRLDDQRSISELVKAGELSLISDEEIADFISYTHRRPIRSRADFDKAAGFLRGVTDPEHKRRIREILPGITKTEFYKVELLRVLDGPADVIVSSHQCSCGGKCTTDGSICGLIGTDECKRDDLP